MPRWDPERFQSDIYDDVHSKRTDFFEVKDHRPSPALISMGMRLRAAGWRHCSYCGALIREGTPRGRCESCRTKPCRRGCGALVDTAVRRVCERCASARPCRVDGCQKRSWSAGLCRSHYRDAVWDGIAIGEPDAADVWPGRRVG